MIDDRADKRARGNRPAQPSPRPCYREDLDAMGCRTPDCNHEASGHEIYLHAGCHSDAPPWAEYADGSLVLRCSVCDALVVRIAVASKPRGA